MTDKIDTIRASIEQTIAVLRRVYDPFDYEVADELSALLDNCDAAVARAEKAEGKFVAVVYALENGRHGLVVDDNTHVVVDKIVKLKVDYDGAIARAEKAEAALEAALIEGCRMGLAAVAITAFGWDNYAVASRAINTLDPAQIVKENEK